MEFTRPLHEVVNKDVAMFLREHGHNEYCDCYLHTDNDMQDDYEMWTRNQHCNANLPDSAERIAAPYVTDALLWIMRYMGVIFYSEYDKYKKLYKAYITYYDGAGLCHTLMSEDDDFQVAISNALDLLVEDYTFLKIHEGWTKK